MFNIIVNYWAKIEICMKSAIKIPEEAYRLTNITTC